MSELQIMVLLLSFLGLPLVALGYLMPRLPRNRLAGIRFAATLEDERVWRDTHVRAGPRFRLVGWLIFGSGAVITAVPLPDWLAVSAFSVISLGAIAWFSADSYRYASARRRHYRTIDEAVRSRD